MVTGGKNPADSKDQGLFRSFVEQTSVGVSATDEEGILIFWDQVQERITGIAADQVLGHPVWDVHFRLLPSVQQTPQMLERLSETFLGVLHSGHFDDEAQRQSAFECCQPDGSFYFLKVEVYPIPTRKGYCLFNVSQDVTNRRKAEDALRWSETRFRSMMEQARDGIVIFDMQENVIEWNEGCEEVTGILRSEAIGSTLTKLFPDLFRTRDSEDVDEESLHNRLIRDLNLISRSSLPRTHEGQIYHSTRMRKWIQAVIFPIRIGKHRLFGMIARDVTLQKQSEERLERYTRQLETLRQAGLEISAELGLDALVWLIAPRAVELLNGGAMALYLHNAEKDVLELALSIGENQPRLEKQVKRGESLAGGVWEEGKPVLFEDYHTGLTGDLDKSYWGKVAGAPIIWASEFLGVVFVFSDQAFYESDLKILELFSAHAAAAIRNARLHQQLSQMAVTDPLTGIYNRRYFFEIAEKEFREAVRYKRPLSVVMFDLDYFKKINDTFGHARGDEILRAVVHRCVENVRQADTIGRYGGEEFVIILPETGPDQGFALIERLRQNLASSPVDTDSTPALVTASFGIASLKPGVRDLLSLLNRADIALYHAKQSGRNRCVLWSDDLQSGFPSVDP